MKKGRKKHTHTPKKPKKTPKNKKETQKQNRTKTIYIKLHKN